MQALLTSQATINTDEWIKGTPGQWIKETPVALAWVLPGAEGGWIGEIYYKRTGELLYQCTRPTSEGARFAVDRMLK